MEGSEGQSSANASPSKTVRAARGVRAGKTTGMDLGPHRWAVSRASCGPTHSIEHHSLDGQPVSRCGPRGSMAFVELGRCSERTAGRTSATGPISPGRRAGTLRFPAAARGPAGSHHALGNIQGQGGGRRTNGPLEARRCSPPGPVKPLKACLPSPPKRCLNKKHRCQVGPMVDFRTAQLRGSFQQPAKRQP